MSHFHALEEASRAGRPVIFVMEDGTIHYVEKVLVHGCNFVFFDFGWTERTAAGRSIHVVSGPPREATPGQWKWGDVEALIVDEGFFLDGEWQDWKRGEAGRDSSWERAEGLVRRIMRLADPE